jgi:pimeloyl-ACP methyl ester carboxylesterase
MTSFTIPTPLETIDLTMNDGAVIRIRRHGNMDGPRVILAHGNGFATDAYYPFWQHLLEQFEVVLYDQRNHGHNPRHEIAHHDVPYFVSDMETIFQGVRTRFGEKKTAGIFHSISAVTAIWHALDVGWRWDALVLFDPPLVPSVGHPLHEIARDFELMLSGWSKDRPERFSDPEVLAEQFRKSKSLSRWVEGSHDLMARSILRRDEAAGDWVLCCPPAGESQVYATNSTLDLCPRLGALKGPVKFVTSDPEDPNARSPGLVNRALHEEFGHPYEVVPGTTHMVQIEKPVECASIVVAFLREAGVTS